MLPDDDHLYRALSTHDERFDGRFFVGVRTTGIYCRPVCRVRLPRRPNCRFFPSAAAAERAGFRPCLRCRPELAPGTASVDAASRLARSAAAAIDEGALEAGSLSALAARLGVTDRHLRRVFGEEFGVAPVDYAQSQRLLLAKRLLTDTAMPVVDVAFAAGFSSLRRLNAAFAERYRMSPGRLRREARASRGGDADRDTAEVAIALAYRPPLDWDRMLEFLERRALDGVEQVADGAYRRAVSLRLADGATTPGWLAVRHDARRQRVQLTLSPALAHAIPKLIGRTKRLFDLGCRPDEVAAGLGALAADCPGLRLPGAFEGFEVAVRAVLGQQVTVAAARTLAARLARAFGEPVQTPWPQVCRAFPSAERIAALEPGQIAALGVIGARARGIVALARAVAEGGLVLEPGGPVEDTLERLRALPGIGDWTAQYVAMRALAWPDAFPAADVGIRRALGVATAARAVEAAQAWQPWRAYAVMHLWRRLEAGAPPWMETAR